MGAGSIQNCQVVLSGQRKRKFSTAREGRCDSWQRGSELTFLSLDQPRHDLPRLQHVLGQLLVPNQILSDKGEELVWCLLTHRAQHDAPGRLSMPQATSPRMCCFCFLCSESLYGDSVPRSPLLPTRRKCLVYCALIINLLSVCFWKGLL